MHCENAAHKSECEGKDFQDRVSICVLFFVRSFVLLCITLVCFVSKWAKIKFLIAYVNGVHMFKVHVSPYQPSLAMAKIILDCFFLLLSCSR